MTILYNKLRFSSKMLAFAILVWFIFFMTVPIWNDKSSEGTGFIFLPWGEIGSHSPEGGYFVLFSLAYMVVSVLISLLLGWISQYVITVMTDMIASIKLRKNNQQGHERTG